MNQDVGVLLRRIRIRDPLSLGGIAALLVALSLFAFLITSLLRAMSERRDIQTEYETAMASVTQLKRVQEASPVNLRQRIAELDEQLQALLVDFPTTQQAADELVRYYTYANETNTQLVRMEKRLATPEEEAVAEAYQVERFVIEAQGAAPNLMRFLARIATGAYKTFLLDNIEIMQDRPAAAEADLAVYSSDLAAGDAGPPPQSPPASQQPASDILPRAPISALRTLVKEALGGTTAEGTATASATPEVPPLKTVHIVKAGDSLALLAKQYGVTAQEIIQANNLRNWTLFEGQRLIIPRR